MPLTLDQPERLFQLTCEGSWPTSVAFLGDSRRLVAGNQRGELFLWDLDREPLPPDEETLKRDAERRPNIHPVRRLDGHAGQILRLLWSDGEQRLVSSGADRKIRVWDVAVAAAGSDQAVLDADQRKSAAKRNKSNAEAILTAPGVEVETQPAQETLAGHADWVYGLALAADGRRLVSGDDAGRTIVWDWPRRKEIARWDGHKMCGVVSTAVAPDSSKCFVAEFRMRRGDFDRPPAQAKLFALDGGELLVDLLVVQFPDVKERDNSYGYGTKWHKFVGNGFVASAFSPDGKLLAVGQGGEIGDAETHLIQVADGQLLRSVGKHKYGVCDLAFSADGAHLLTSGRDTTVRIFQTSDGKEVAALGAPRGGQFKDWISAIALSPDERLLAAADISGSIQVWRLRK